MSGKQRISIEQIIKAAIGIIRKSGWEGVSARSIAKALKSSTMPIYSSIGSMESIKKQIRQEALSLLEAYQGRTWTENPLMNRAIGYIQFAKAEGKLFRFMYDARGEEQTTVEKVEEGVIAAADADFMAVFGNMPREGAAAATFHCWVYIHGLACLLADNHLGIQDDELRHLLERACGAIVAKIGGSND